MKNRYEDRVFAIYKGDKFIDVGTAKELSERLNMKQTSIRWLSSPEAHRRNKGKKTIAILINDDNEELS